MRKVTNNAGFVHFIISLLIAACILYGAQQYKVATCRVLAEVQGEPINENTCR